MKPIVIDSISSYRLIDPTEYSPLSKETLSKFMDLAKNNKVKFYVVDSNATRKNGQTVYKLI